MIRTLASIVLTVTVLVVPPTASADGHESDPPVDETPPTLHLPDPITAVAAPLPGTGEWVWYHAWASDDTDPSPMLTCVPPSGSHFQLGTTTVECTATDSSGNSASGMFTVTVQPYGPPPDVTPPTMLLPAPMIIDAANDSGAVVWYWVQAMDERDGFVIAVCVPPSGSLFPVGTTTVECTAADRSGNTARGSFDVTVLPPFVIELTVDSVGSVNPVTGVATVGGTVTCSRAGEVFIGGELTQRMGRSVFSGRLAAANVGCSPTTRTWRQQIQDATGLFVPGSATVKVSAFRWPSRAHVEATIRLRSAR